MQPPSNSKQPYRSGSRFTPQPYFFEAIQPYVPSRFLELPRFRSRELSGCQPPVSGHYQGYPSEDTNQSRSQSTIRCPHTTCSQSSSSAAPVPSKCATPAAAQQHEEPTVSSSPIQENPSTSDEAQRHCHDVCANLHGLPTMPDASGGRRSSTKRQRSTASQAPESEKKKMEEKGGNFSREELQLELLDILGNFLSTWQTYLQALQEKLGSKAGPLFEKIGAYPVPTL